MDNANSREYLEKILSQVLENMKRTAHAPSVQMTEVPRESLGLNDDDEAALDDLDEDMNADARNTQRRADKYVEKNGDLSDSDDEDMEGGPGRVPGRDMRRARLNYRNIMDVGADSGVETGSVGTPQLGSSLPDENDDMNLDAVGTGNQTPSPPRALNGSAAVSGEQSPQPPTTNDDDVTMGDADATTTAEPPPPPPNPVAMVDIPIGQQPVTPPDSPPPQVQVPTSAPAAPAAATAPTTNGVPESSTEVAPQTETEALQEQMDREDRAIKAEEEGRMEREIENAEAEARTVVVAKAEEL
jgi:histone deacetylase 1/2